MDTTRRAAGLGLLTYGLATIVAFTTLRSPGGSYSNAVVRDYVSGNWVAAFAVCYLGAFGALGLLVFGARMRHVMGSSGDLVWGLMAAATAVSVVGWFVDGGVVVAMAEGGSAVQSGVPHPVVYTVTEIGNLLAIFAPPFFIGVFAIMFAVRFARPVWVRVFCVVAGLCGILAPGYFTYFVFMIWTLVFSGWLIATARRSTPAEQPQPSLV